MMNRYAEESEKLAEKYDLENLAKKMRSAEATDAVRDSITGVFEQYQNDVAAVKDALVAEEPVSHFALYILSQEYYYMDGDSLASLLAPLTATL